MRTSFSAAALVVTLACPVRQAAAQNTAPVPVISTAAQGEVRVNPDRARVWLSVQTRAQSAGDAAAENARRQTAVISALRSLSLPDSQISTRTYTIVPETRYDNETRTPRVVSYLVTNSLAVELVDVSSVGRIIDTALASGANEVASIEFYSSRSAESYRAALADAVAHAQAEATVMARAAGGRLGPLLEIANSDGGWAQPEAKAMQSMSLSAAAVTPIMSGPQTITAAVTGRWIFLPDH